MRQLGLNIRLKDWAVFDSYLIGDNQEVVSYLLDLFRQTDSVVWIWGEQAVGKTHLLQAACAHFDEHGVVYVPCSHNRADSTHDSVNVSILAGLGDLGLVCLDDIQDVVEQPSWEESLFGLFNDLQDSGGKLLVASESPPTDLSFTLADLASRMSWGPVFRVKSMTDEQRVKALELRARIRGFELPQDTSSYLLRRYSRDTNQLFELLDELDTASLAAQRRLTVPFVKSVLERK